MRRYFSLTVALVATVLVTACAGTDESPSGPSGGSLEPGTERSLRNTGLVPAERVTQIPSYRIDSWSRIDATQVVISTAGDERFLIRLFSPCTGLATADSLGFTTTAGSLDAFESLVVEDVSGRLESCDIAEIRRLRSAAAPRHEG